MNYIYKLPIILILIVVQGCAHKPFPKPGENAAVLNLVKQSYVKGCVDGHHQNKEKKIYYVCQEMSKKYIKDIEEIIR